MDVARVAAVEFGEPQKCYGHCEEKATFRILKSGEAVIACYACPSSYVSKVMAYGPSSTRETLRLFLSEALEGGPSLKEGDIRTATRHVWDLRTVNSDISAAYWTQNYRGSKSDDPSWKALFTCARCGTLFLQPLAVKNTLCGRCSS